jgi:hypothetical protein
LCGTARPLNVQAVERPSSDEGLTTLLGTSPDDTVHQPRIGRADEQRPLAAARDPDHDDMARVAVGTRAQAAQRADEVLQRDVLHRVRQPGLAEVGQRHRRVSV